MTRGRRGVGRGRPWVPDSSPSGHPLAEQARTEALLPDFTPAAVPFPAPLPGPGPEAVSPPEPDWSPPWSASPELSAQHPSEQPSEQPAPSPPRYPGKITVTRVAAWRSRQLVSGGARRFHRATTADGAGRSGLSSLTYATMMNYAADAAIAVALANTLFFAAATAESRTNVALYLLITVAPFGMIAPVVGPLLDRLQHGRRVAMAMSFVGRSLLLVVMAMHVQDWLLYPAALGFMVLSKSFGVLKAAVTPRVLPPEITLVKTNSRLTVFGLVAGGLVGAVASGVAALAGSSGALWFTAVVCLGGAALCLRIPAWVEVTEGEVPASLRTQTPQQSPEKPPVHRRQPMSRQVVVALWGNATARVLTGFLTLFMAFVVKAQTEGSPGRQLMLLGLVGAAAGMGSFLGNAIGARLHFGKPDQAILGCVAAGLTMAVFTALVEGIVVVAVTALVAATCSAIAKVCLDAVIQRDLPEASRASAFGRSETVVQLAWVVGGTLGVLLPPTYWIGFASVSALLAVGLTQTLLARRGSSLLAAFLAMSVFAGCAAAPDREVTFSSAGHSVTTGPIRYCDIELTECEQDDSAIAVIAVTTGEPVHISVPDSVAQAPWQVVFRYRSSGEQVGGRSEVFTPGTRHDYLLQVPDSGTLETLEVQQYGAPELVNGESNFRISAAWALSVGAGR